MGISSGVRRCRICASSLILPRRRRVPETALETAAMSCSCILLCYILGSRLLALGSFSKASKCQPGSDMDACTGPQAARDRKTDAEQRRGRPDSGANAFLEFLIAEPLTLVICRSGIHEDAVPESRYPKRRCRRYSQLDRARDERVSDGVAGAEPAEIARATEHRLVEVPAPAG